MAKSSLEHKSNTMERRKFSEDSKQPSPIDDYYMRKKERRSKESFPSRHDQKENPIANNIGGSPGIRKEALVCVASRP